MSCFCTYRVAVDVGPCGPSIPPLLVDLVLAAPSMLWALCCLSVSTAVAKPTQFFKQPHLCAVPMVTACSVPRCSRDRGQGYVPTSPPPLEPTKSSPPGRGLPGG